MATISEIHIFPVKGLSGTRMESAQLGRRGLENDRRWMLIDPDGVFLSQRELPEMVLLQASIADGALRVRDLRGRQDDLVLPLNGDLRKKARAQIWMDWVDAEIVGSEADAWFKSVLQTPCRLVYMPETTARQVDLNYAQAGDIAAFSDGYPYLIASESSLADLNAHLKGRMHAEMLRFRPNIVLRGTEPWEEDDWKTIQIGRAVFRTPKPCARCTVVTIDPSTGAEGKEPLKTLSTFRKKGNNVIFGANACWDNCDTPMEIRVGDPFLRLG
jgi:uncharacterized protein YcbX